MSYLLRGVILEFSTWTELGIIEIFVTSQILHKTGEEEDSISLFLCIFVSKGIFNMFLQHINRIKIVDGSNLNLIFSRLHNNFVFSFFA